MVSRKCSTDDLDYEYSTDAEENSDAEYESSVRERQSRKRRQFRDVSEDGSEYASKKNRSDSKNAQMARANRLKKKRYLQNLEKKLEKLRDENGKLNSILENQSFVIKDLRKEVKYVKNILANSADISKLLKTINGRTGMPVTSSLNKDFTFQNDFALKNTSGKMACSWNASCIEPSYPSFPTPNSTDNLDSPNYSDENDYLGVLDTNIFSELDFPLNNNCLPMQFDDEEVPSCVKQDDADLKLTLEEHNYTMTSDNCDDDYGICLHIAKGKLSLELCSSCGENAVQTWKEVE